MYNMLLNNREFVKGPVLEFTKNLIKTPSLSLGEEKAANLIENEMNHLGYDKVFKDEFGNVVGIIYGKNSDETVILNSHMDHIAPEGNWDRDPYSGNIEGNKIYGVGASDCKGGLAAQIYGAAMLRHSLLPLKGNVVVCATVAEENGRSIGIRGIIEKTLPSIAIKPKYVILGEATGLGLFYGHDGWAEIDISIEGANAFHVEDAAKAIYNQLSDANQRDMQNPSRFMSLKKFAFEENKGCKKATISLNKRLLQEENIDGVIYNLKHNASLMAQNSGAVAIAVDICTEEQTLYTGHVSAVRNITQAWTTDPYHPLMGRARQALSAAGCEARAGRWRLNQIEMGTAGSYLVNECKIPTIGYGPGLEEQTHAINEYVGIDNINEAVFGTAAILHSLVGIPVFGWTSDEEI